MPATTVPVASWFSGSQVFGFWKLGLDLGSLALGLWCFLVFKNHPQLGWGNVPNVSPAFFICYNKFESRLMYGSWF